MKLQATKSSIIEIADAATRRTFEGKMDPQEIETFLNVMRSEYTPSPLFATAELNAIVVGGQVLCKPNASYHFNHIVWGLGVSDVQSIGALYTAYSNWDDFWKNSSSFWAQGLADDGGIYMITYFDDHHAPTGQFVGPCSGIALFEGGGKGHWHKN